METEEENKTETNSSDKTGENALKAALGALAAGATLLPATGRCNLTVNVHVGDVYNGVSPTSAS